jgi:hypothetical protein
MNAVVVPPRGIVVHRRDNQIRIIRKWFDDRIVILMIWLVFWDLALAFLMPFWFRDFSLTPLGSFWNEPVTFIFSLFPDILMPVMPLLLIIITVLLNYYACAGFVNETFVDVDTNLITVFHRPLPFWGNKKIYAKVVERVYVTKFSSRGQVTYNIRLRIKGKGRVKLLSNINDYEQAKFIQKEIAEMLV